MPNEDCRKGEVDIEGCLNCGETHCIHDDSRYLQKLRKQQRDCEIVKLFEEGKSYKELQSHFNTGKRTIQRALTQ